MNEKDAETYSVRIWRSPDNNRILKMEWRAPNGDLHRPDGPAIEEWNSFGELTKQEFFQHGQRHRDDGPALIEWEPQTQTKILEIWAVGGSIHRDGDLPAYVERERSSGMTITVKYYQNGEIHRDQGPASIYRNAESGIAVRQVWMLHAQSHRDGDKPAEIIRNSDTGVITEEHFAQNNLWHRENGPAVIRRDPVSGEICDTIFYLHGNRDERNQTLNFD